MAKDLQRPALGDRAWLYTNTQMGNRSPTIQVYRGAISFELTASADDTSPARPACNLDQLQSLGQLVLDRLPGE